jgi:hypothetical protein
MSMEEKPTDGYNYLFYPGRASHRLANAVRGRSKCCMLIGRASVCAPYQLSCIEENLNLYPGSTSTSYSGHAVDKVVGVPKVEN